MTTFGWIKIQTDENHHVWKDLTTGIICGDSLKNKINSEILKQVHNGSIYNDTKRS